MMESMPDPLLEYRREFPIAEKAVYLVSHSLGAMPRRARHAMLDYADTWEQRGVRAWAEGWWTLQDDVGGLLAPILGVEKGTISMHQNVTIASMAFLSCFQPRPPRNKVVYTAMNFPGVMYLYDAHQVRGFEVVRVPSPDGVGVDLDQLLDAIDDRTLLVPISHVFFRSAFIQDARAIVAKAEKVGAMVVLDVFQSVGTVPLKLLEWGCHAAVGGALKFLCGGPGACFLYVRSDVARGLAPAFTGWMAHKRPFEFETEQIDRREDGGRFLTGTPNVPALYAAREGIRIIGAIGVEAIRRKSMRQTAAMLAKADAMGLRVTTPRDPERRGATIAVDVPDGYAVTQELLARQFIVDYRPGAGIRIAPHFYTTDEECDRVLDEIRSIMAQGAHARHRGADRKPG
jgi:kynureninase